MVLKMTWPAVEGRHEEGLDEYAVGIVNLPGDVDDVGHLHQVLISQERDERVSVPDGFSILDGRLDVLPEHDQVPCPWINAGQCLGTSEVKSLGLA